MNKRTSTYLTLGIIFILIGMSTYYGNSLSTIDMIELEFKANYLDNDMRIGDLEISSQKPIYTGHNDDRVCPENFARVEPSGEYFTSIIKVGEEEKKFEHGETENFGVFDITYETSGCLKYDEEIEGLIKMDYREENDWINTLTIRFTEESRFNVSEIFHIQKNTIMLRIVNNIADFEDNEAGFIIKVIPKLLSEDRHSDYYYVDINKGSGDYFIQIENDVLGDIDLIIRPFFVIQTNQEEIFYGEEIEFSYDSEYLQPKNSNEITGDAVVEPKPMSFIEFIMNIWGKIIGIFM